MSAPLGGRTQDRYTVPLLHQVIHRDASRDCRDCWMDLVVQLSECFWCSRQPRKSPSLADQNTAVMALQDATIGKSQERTIAPLCWNSDNVSECD